MRCDACGGDIAASAVLCSNCRAALTRPCHACGEPMPLSARFCPACGTAVAAHQQRLEDVPPTNEPDRGSREATAPATRPPPPRATPAPPFEQGPETGNAREGDFHLPPSQDGAKSLSGVARNVDIRPGTNYPVLVFRLDRFDSGGNRLPSVGVHCEPFRKGQISDGDEVVVEGRWKKGTLHSRRVRNLSTGAEIVQGYSRTEKIAGGAFLVVFCAIFVGILVTLLVTALLSL